MDILERARGHELHVSEAALSFFKAPPTLDATPAALSQPWMDLALLPRPDAVALCADQVHMADNGQQPLSLIAGAGSSPMADHDMRTCHSQGAHTRSPRGCTSGRANIGGGGSG
ncbi:MAG: hypothetical protein WDW38_005090 [Sanguina aurantia]